MKHLITVILVFIQTLLNAATFTVTNTNDSGAGSFRQAILDANGSTGADYIVFNIPTSDPGYNATTGVWTISPLTDYPMISGGFTSIDATTQTTNQSNTNPYGPEICLDGGSTRTYAFRVVSPNNTIKGFIIGRFDFGIQLYGTYATNNIITQNYIGTNESGTSQFKNNYGIGISGNAAQIQITNNLISGNNSAGIVLSSGTQITISGNKIGTTISGLAPLPNPAGIILDNSPSNTIGGTTFSMKNIISGNTDEGILINGSASIYNIVIGNFIGTNVLGLDTIPNGNGVVVVNAPNNTIGGTTLGERNVISGNTTCGIFLNGTGTNNNVIIGNYIGVDSTGNSALSNHYGVIIKADADKNTVGGNTASKRNVISANWEIGVYIEASDSNVVSGNFIGTNCTGTAAFFVGVDSLLQANGVEINTVSKYNLIGGATAGERNIISGNRVYGAIYYGQVSLNNIAGNYIGTDVTGTYSIPNATGICVDDASNHNIMENNLLSGNKSYGLFIVTSGSVSNSFRGNFVGTNALGTDSIPNDVGLLIAGGAKSNMIGGYNATDRNIFSGNRYGGVEITDNGTDYNKIIGNLIGTDITGNSALPNQMGLVVSNLVTGTRIEKNVISGNGSFGLILTDHSDSSLVIGNQIGVGKDNVTNLGNKSIGIGLSNGTINNVIGSVNNSNVIAYNDSTGILIMDNSTLNNRISANSIYDNNNLGIEIFPGGVNSNDAGDTDSGPNNLMNFPVITSIGYNPTSGNTFIMGTLDTQNPQLATVEIFKSSPDLLFNHGEGKVYLGNATPDNTGHWTAFIDGLVDGDLVTTTATDKDGNTSEFSLNYTTVVSVQEQDKSSNQVTIFPNPATNSATLIYTLEESGNVEIMMFDFTGKQLNVFVNEKQIKGLHRLSLAFDETMVSGIYFIKLKINNEKQSFLKLSIQK